MFNRNCRPIVDIVAESLICKVLSSVLCEENRLDYLLRSVSAQLLFAKIIAMPSDGFLIAGVAVQNEDSE